MNHQPFENWLLSDESLSEKEQQMLEVHLNECKTCSALSIALEQVHETFANHIAPTSAPGFVQRWQGRLSIVRQQRQQRKIWFLTLGLFGIAGLILFTVFVLNFNRTNWFYMVSQVFANFSLFASRINRIVNVTKTLITELPFLIPIMIIFIVGGASAMFTLIVTWVSSMIKLYKVPNEGVTVR